MSELHQFLGRLMEVLKLELLAGTVSLPFLVRCHGPLPTQHLMSSGIAQEHASDRPFYD